MKKTILSLLVVLMATTGARAQSPTTSGIDWNPSTNSGTFQMPAYDVEVSTELWYLVNEEKTLDENIAAYGGKSDFFLNRTLTANVWNTFASPFAIAAGDMTKYFRAYFVMHEAAAKLARAFVINFGEGETTGISLTPAPSPKGEGSIYTLDGRRIQGQPTQKGVYIQNGKKVVIK